MSIQSKRLSEIFWKIVQSTIWRKTLLKGYINDFSVYYNTVDITNIIDIHEYLMEKHKIMFRSNKKVFIVLLSFSG